MFLGKKKLPYPLKWRKVISRSKASLPVEAQLSDQILHRLGKSANQIGSQKVWPKKLDHNLRSSWPKKIVIFFSARNLHLCYPDQKVISARQLISRFQAVWNFSVLDKSRDVCEAHIDWHQSQWKYKLLLAGDDVTLGKMPFGGKTVDFSVLVHQNHPQEMYHLYTTCALFKSTMGNFDKNAFLNITSPRDFNLKHAATKKMLPSIVAGGSSNVKNRMIEIEVERAIPQNLEAITWQNWRLLRRHFGTARMVIQLLTCCLPGSGNKFKSNPETQKACSTWVYSIRSRKNNHRFC